MVLTPEEAGRNRKLTDKEQQMITFACVAIDNRLKDAYTHNPNATSVSVEVTLPMLLEVQVRALYQDAGWDVKGDTNRNESYLVFTPKRK
jgi:hypothetical protein